MLLRLNATVEGRQHLPRSGPVVIAARHYHHLYDGCLLIAVCPRRTRLLVALDWVRSRPGRWFMEGVCGLAGWPVALRPDAMAATGRSAYRPNEARRYVARAARQAAALLATGGVLLVFPEAYPTVDPMYSPKRGDGEFLPFRPGFVRLAELARRAGGTPVAIVPAGLAYQRGRRWRATLRFGTPRYLQPGADRAAFAREIEEAVRALSSPQRA